MRRLLLVTLFISAFTLVACQSAPTRKTDSPVIVTKLGVSEITPAEARPGVEAAYSQFVDVRTPEEYSAGHADRARNIPLDTLMANLDRLEKNEPVYLICKSGHRSKLAAEMLVKAGFPQAISISGGTDAWRAAGLKMVEPTEGTNGKSAR